MGSDKAKCPHCGERYNYTREEIEPADDMIFVDCECQNCNKQFVEIFKIWKVEKKK